MIFADILRKNRKLMENIAQAADSSAYNLIFYFYFVILLVDSGVWNFEFGLDWRLGIDSHQWFPNLQVCIIILQICTTKFWKCNGKESYNVLLICNISTCHSTLTIKALPIASIQPLSLFDNAMPNVKLKQHVVLKTKALKI